MGSMQCQFPEIEKIWTYVDNGPANRRAAWNKPPAGYNQVILLGLYHSAALPRVSGRNTAPITTVIRHTMIGYHRP